MKRSSYGALFRMPPPWEVVQQVLTQLKLGPNLPISFQKENLCLDDSAELATLLLPYYIPCKGDHFLGVTDEKRWVTILRHILSFHNYCITTKETTHMKHKICIYTIERITSDLEAPVIVSFD